MGENTFIPALELASNRPSASSTTSPAEWHRPWLREEVSSRSGLSYKSLGNPFLAEIAQSLADAAAKEGFSLLLGALRDREAIHPEAIEKSTGGLLAHHVQALVIFAGIDPSSLPVLESARQSGTVVVTATG